jgi:hypothetical protein
VSASGVEAEGKYCIIIVDTNQDVVKSQVFVVVAFALLHYLEE